MLIPLPFSVLPFSFVPFLSCWSVLLVQLLYLIVMAFIVLSNVSGVCNTGGSWGGSSIVKVPGDVPR